MVGVKWDEIAGVVVYTETKIVKEVEKRVSERRTYNPGCSLST
jgi:hypothetical protein